MWLKIWVSFELNWELNTSQRWNQYFMEPLIACLVRINLFHGYLINSCISCPLFSDNIVKPLCETEQKKETPCWMFVVVVGIWLFCCLRKLESRARFDSSYFSSSSSPWEKFLYQWFELLGLCNCNFIYMVICKWISFIFYSFIELIALILFFWLIFFLDPCGFYVCESILFVVVC